MNNPTPHPPPMTIHKFRRAAVRGGPGASPPRTSPGCGQRRGGETPAGPIPAATAPEVGTGTRLHRPCRQLTAGHRRSAPRTAPLPPVGRALRASRSVRGWTISPPRVRPGPTHSRYQGKHSDSARILPHSPPMNDLPGCRPAEARPLFPEGAMGRRGRRLCRPDSPSRPGSHPRTAVLSDVAFRSWPRGASPVLRRRGVRRKIRVARHGAKGYDARQSEGPVRGCAGPGKE